MGGKLGLYFGLSLEDYKRIVSNMENDWLKDPLVLFFCATKISFVQRLTDIGMAMIIRLTGEYRIKKSYISL